MSDGARLGRLARRVHVRALVTTGVRRATGSLLPALQITVGVVTAYAIAHWGFGHAAPLIAVTATITTLGLAGDANPRRVIENAVGITVGIALSEAIVLAIGKGWWQLGIVIFATIVIARGVSANPAFAIAAAVQGTIVVLLPEPEGGVFTRSLDGLIGGVVALAVTALIPRDPRRAAVRDARALFSIFSESLAGLGEALAHADHGAAELALERLRRTQQYVDEWRTSLTSARSIANISPWLRRQRPELQMQERILAGADLTTRHLRSIARRTIVLVEDGAPRPELAGIIAELAHGIDLLGRQVQDRDLTGASRSVFEDLARRLDPVHLAAGDGLRAEVVVVLLRPLVVDLLVAGGMEVDAARAVLPPLRD